MVTLKMSGGGEGTSQGSTEEKGSNLWSLLPTFDPSVDNAKEYADKVRFLWGICPGKDRPMLAPRLAFLCKGTAWSQVKNLDSAKLTDGKTGYKTLLLALPTWEESAELQIYAPFERAFYKTVQKPDETAMSYVNRINVIQRGFRRGWYGDHCESGESICHFETKWTSCRGQEESDLNVRWV